jgi:hypothetical protein
LSGDQGALLAYATVPPSASASIPYAIRASALVQAGATAIIDSAPILAMTVSKGAYVKASGTSTLGNLVVFASAATLDLTHVRQLTITGSGALARVTGNVGNIFATGTGVTVLASITNAAVQARLGAEISMDGGRGQCAISGELALGFILLVYSNTRTRTNTMAD